MFDYYLCFYVTHFTKFPTILLKNKSTYRFEEEEEEEEEEEDLYINYSLDHCWLVIILTVCKSIEVLAETSLRFPAHSLCQN